MLDLCLGNIPGAYVSKHCPALGSSEHNVILLLPKYRQKLKTHKIQTKTIFGSDPSFCADSVIPTKQIKHYANNKPWVTRELKHRLNLKEIAFIQDDKQRVKNLTRELKQKTKDKMEKFTSGDVRDAWKSLNTMMGRTQDAAKIQCPDPVAFAEELNTFYARFNSTDSVEDGVTYNYPSESICVEENL